MTKYKSKWDKWTWFILGLEAIWCIVPCFLDDGIWPIIICILMLAFSLTAFLSISYCIDGEKLIVYTFFIPASYPINKIKEIKPTDIVLSAPAASLTHRLAITFTDKKILKSTTPLIISPKHQEEFIKELLKINPEIIIG